MIGWRNIAASGRSGSIASTITCANCRPRRRRPAASNPGANIRQSDLIATAQKLRRGTMDARNNGGLTITLPSDREIAMTRAFDAPRELVWKAWTEPQHVARWYSCKALTLAVCEIDLRVGGAYRFVMR